jgi:hypothetical protein
MPQRTTGVNPSEETIKIGPIGIRFLLTGDDANGSVSVFQVLVPVGQRLTAPARKNDAYEEILQGIKGALPGRLTAPPLRLVPGRRCASPEARCTASITSAARM